MTWCRKYYLNQWWPSLLVYVCSTSLYVSISFAIIDIFYEFDVYVFSSKLPKDTWCNQWKYANTGPIMACHDDVIKWKHFPRYWSFVRGIHRSPVNSPHKGQWCGTLMFSLICAWTNGWVRTREAGELRCHRAHCDVIVMFWNVVYSSNRNHYTTLLLVFHASERYWGTWLYSVL